MLSREIKKLMPLVKVKSDHWVPTRPAEAGVEFSPVWLVALVERLYVMVVDVEEEADGSDISFLRLTQQ